MIKIFTDSTAYIPQDIQIEHDITVLPLTVTFDGKTVSELEISDDSFYSQIVKEHKIPKSNPLAVDAAYEAFEKEIIEGNTIVGIFISSKISETYQNACKAKDKLLEKYSKANITLVDAGTGGMQAGLAVISAAEVLKKGAWLEEIVDAAQNSINHSKFMFIPKTLKFLEIGGKIGKAQALLGGALQIMPILGVKDGYIAPLESVRVHNRAVDRIFEVFKEDIKKYGAQKVVIHHIDSINLAMELAQRAEEIARVEVMISGIGPVIGSNVGPGAIGIVYKTVEPIPAQ